MRLRNRSDYETMIYNKEGNIMTNKKRILLVSSLLMLPITYLWIQFTASSFGAKWGYVAGLAGYQVYCLLAARLVMWLKNNADKYGYEQTGESWVLRR